MKHIMLYFGSFNPVHNGHTAVASYVTGRQLCDQLWFVVSPRNPFKQDNSLAPAADRLAMTRIAVSEKLDTGIVHVSDVEFRLPVPSYTIDTLDYLSGKFPDCTFSLLGGADLAEGFENWKDYRSLLSKYDFYIYPRDDFRIDTETGNIIYLEDAPRWNFTSTDIRRAIMAGEDIESMVSPGVRDYISEHGLWKPAGGIDSEKLAGPTERIDSEKLAGPTEGIDPGKEATLTKGIEEAPSFDLYMRRGKFYNQSGQFDKALNDFLRAQKLDPDNAEVMAYVTMLREMFAFRHLDYYNP